jgi:DNA-damage-inducible protein D
LLCKKRQIGNKNVFIVFYNDLPFNEYGEEFWYARELQKVLDYSEWRNFNLVIKKAIIACENSGNKGSDHFVDVNKTTAMAKGYLKDKVSV